MPFSSSTAQACCSAVRIAAAVGMAAAGIAILRMPAAPAEAAEPLAFVIPSEEGYGIADCLQSGSECGRAMATSWCEAHGHAHVAAYGTAEDVTGATQGLAEAALTRASVIIRCTD
jgi:hypothetical protein